MTEDPDITNPYSPPRGEDSSELSSTGQFADGLAEPIRAQGTLSLEEGRQIQRLTSGGPVRSVISFLVIAIALMLLLSLVIGDFQLTQQLPGILIVISVLVVGALAMLMGPRVQLHRQWRRNAGIFQPQEYSFAEDDLLVRTDLVETRMKWKAFSQFKCNDEVVLIYLNPPTSFFAVSRTFFDADHDWLAFKRLVERQLTPFNRK